MPKWIRVENETDVFSRPDWEYFEIIRKKRLFYRNLSNFVKKSNFCKKTIWIQIGIFHYSYSFFLWRDAR